VVLDRFDADWRWMVDRADSRATARIFRQPRRGDGRA
jgi:hypothetical protein